MAKPALTGPCRLCGTTKSLRDSHIIPQWVYERLVNRDGVTGPPVRVENGVALLKAEQASERMLCGDCEQMIGTREGYLSRMTPQADGAFPLFDEAHREGRIDEHDDIGRLSPTTDVEAISYVGAAILWRASVSRSHFPEISIGQRYEAEFAQYLRGLGPWPANAIVILKLVNRVKPRTDGILAGPGHDRPAPSVRRYQFAFAGLWFQFFLGSALPHDLANTSLRNGGVVLLTDGTWLLRNVGRRALDAEPKGKLARLGAARPGAR